MLGLQAVDRDDDRQPFDVAPLGGNLAHGARHELHVNPARGKQRQDRVQLAIADERFAADDRHVQRLVPIDQRDDAVDELLALEVADLPQRDLAAEVIVAVGVAAGASQRAFARDLDGKGRGISAEDAAPCSEDAFHIGTHYISVCYDSPVSPRSDI